MPKTNTLASFFKKLYPVHDFQKQKGISFHYFQHYKKSLRAHLHNHTFHHVNHPVHHGLALVPCQKMDRFTGNAEMKYDRYIWWYLSVTKLPQFPLFLSLGVMEPPKDTLPGKRVCLLVKSEFSPSKCNGEACSEF